MKLFAENALLHTGWAQNVTLTVDAAGMITAGHAFQVSANGVWLTASVPPEYLHRLG